MITLTNRIDMRPGAVPLVIHLGQYDSDFSLVFELYSSAGNFTVESGTTAMIRGTKTDGHAYDADATLDVSAKTVTVAGSEQMTAAKGRNVYELVLTKSGKVLSTANFILDVERAAMDADTIASESVLKELNAIIAGAATSTQAAADAASAADRAEDAAESVSNASAQIATNTEDISDLKADLKHAFEIIQNNPFSNNGYIDTYGAFQSNDYYSCTDYIGVSGYTKLLFLGSFGILSSGFGNVVGYDDAHNYTGVLFHATENTVYPVTVDLENASYIRIVTNKNNLNITGYFPSSELQTVLSNTNDKIEKLEQGQDIVDDAEVFYGKNILDAELLNKEVGRLKRTSGVVSTSSTDYYTSDFVICDSDTQYYCSVLGSNGVQRVKSSPRDICYYDSNKIFISGEAGSSPFVTPANTCYIRISYKNTDRVTDIMISTDDNITEYEAFESYIRWKHPDDRCVTIDVLSEQYYTKATSDLKFILNGLYGKTINCLGDSFTHDSEAWHVTLKNRCGCNTNLYGLGNSRISVDYINSSGTTVPSFLNRYRSMSTDADITIIFGGINDATSIVNGDIELGTINSEHTNTTFYGALQLLLDGIIAMMPSKCIFGVIPPNFYPSGNQYNALKLVQTACREVYEKYSVPYADVAKDCFQMSSDSNIMPFYRRSVVEPANYHPNAQGHIAICDIIQGRLQEVYH